MLETESLPNLVLPPCGQSPSLPSGTLANSFVWYREAAAVNLLLIAHSHPCVRAKQLIASSSLVENAKRQKREELQIMLCDRQAA